MSETDDVPVIRFQAMIDKIQTMVDGGIRVSFDMINPVSPETIVDLFEAKQPGTTVEIAGIVFKTGKPQETEKTKKPDNGKKHRKAEKNTGNSEPPY